MQSCRCLLSCRLLGPALVANARSYGQRLESKQWKQRPNRRSKLALILTEDVSKLGRSGHVVRVEHGYGRNWLLPQGKAVYATPDNIERYNAKEQDADSDIDVEAFVRNVFSRHQITLTAPGAVNEGGAWAVYEHHIAKELRRFRLHVPLDCIHLPAPLTSHGAHEVSLKIDERTDIPFTVHVVPQLSSQTSNEMATT